MLSVALAGLAPSLVSAAENAATVLSVSPSVASHEGGKVTTLEVKMKVPVAATVVSDAAGRAQLMFPDTTTISIAPGTEIALAEFVDDPNEESIIINMAVGTARVITGEVSRRKPSAMVLNMPQASIGIRGTMVTVVVSGDTTKVYLTETSGLGVSVTNRSTGEQKKMVKPGMLIEVTPRGMEERPGTLEEVRQMTVDLHTAPRLTDDERRVPVGVASVTPAGIHGIAGNMDMSVNPSSSGVNVPSMAPSVDPGPQVSQYMGTFLSNPDPINGMGQGDLLTFTVDSDANISGATARVSRFQMQGMDQDFVGVGGSGNVGSGGVVNINGYTQAGPNVSSPFNSMSTTGSFNGTDSGSFTNTVEVAPPIGGPAVPLSENGNFQRQ